MKTLKRLSLMFCALIVVAGLNVSASGQTAEDSNRLAAIGAAGSSIRWEVAVPNSGGTITISAPDGRVFRKEFRAGSVPEFTVIDKQGERLPDGVYTYEVRLSPVLSAAVKEKLAAARGKDDDSEEIRATRKREIPPALVQSGSFSISGGSVVVAGSAEEAGQRRVSQVRERSLPALSSNNRTTKSSQHHPLMISSPDDVIPDDLIVQGSLCAGLDCVNGEVFGFDTIRLKENNTRLQFEDTSAAGFPLNNWQIRANSSGAGGASFLAFVDQGAAGNSETGTIVFEVDAGAPANSLKVASSGKVGLRTATPVLDVHANTSDTPAIRLEQNNSGGFAAQTWDIAGNEANFFVRDVTGGSRLPFRIRPGAPTSSIDIAASGNVGIGTQTPTSKLHAVTAATGYTALLNLQGTADPGNGATRLSLNNTQSNLLGSAYGSGAPGVLANAAGLFVDTPSSAFILGSGTGIPVSFITNSDFANVRLQITSAGSVGIGTTAPTDTLSVNGTASKPGGGAWAVFSDERLKNIKGRFLPGLQAVMQLRPLRYEYKPNNALGLKSNQEYVGFGAQALQQVIPEAVTRNESGYLQVNNDPIMWTMLNAIQEQQKEIQELKKEIRKLRAASRRRR